MALVNQEYLKLQVAQPSASGAGASSSAPSATTTTTLDAATIAQDFSDDIYTQTAQEEEQTPRTNSSGNSPSPYISDPIMAILMDRSNYESPDEDRNVTAESISRSLSKVAQYEVSEYGKAETIYASGNYNMGFTHDGKIVNGSCTEGGMKKAALGDYITVTKSVDDDGDGIGDREVEMRGTDAMAAENDSVLDLYTRAQFNKVLEEYGWGTFSNNCNFMKNRDAIREKYGIDIKEVPTEGPDGIAHRTYEISMVDKDGHIIEDAEGNKSTILFGDWIIPDGCAQGAEQHFISVLDMAGYDCISEADFIDNEAFAAVPEFQDENGNYDPAKAYTYVLAQIEEDFKNMRAGGESKYMRASNQTIDTATFVNSKFEWWSKGGDSQYYANSGIDPSLLGPLSSELAAYDLDGDGKLNDEERAAFGKDAQEGKTAKGKAAEEKAAQQTSDSKTVQAQAREYEENMEEAVDAFAEELEQLEEENGAAVSRLEKRKLVRDIAKRSNVDRYALLREV